MTILAFTGMELWISIWFDVQRGGIKFCYFGTLCGVEITSNLTVKKLLKIFAVALHVSPTQTLGQVQ